MDALSSSSGIGVFIGFKKWADEGVRVSPKDFIGYYLYQDEKTCDEYEQRNPWNYDKIRVSVDF